MLATQQATMPDNFPQATSAAQVTARKAASTRRRRTYASKAQQDAYNRYIRGGLEALQTGDVELLATHPYLRPSQRQWFAELITKAAA